MRRPAVVFRPPLAPPGGLLLHRDRDILTRYAVAVEIEGEEKPALAADSLTLAIIA
jgi:hypothetical protein